eukprot:CAMPEP_0170903080 /NCGR_PEP_ID=MMETSP0734-20130129/49503_1 /TAXON_ID=186038 /ORGANISM="Fragilariopsis kerguelensis, Strain L26-C5" /LENGTH=115 /DNA_ID=CAMNT_0011298097 /DNA_START=254 /DNA_END=601 /DNA_ORIENTATION=-
MGTNPPVTVNCAYGLETVTQDPTTKITRMRTIFSGEETEKLAKTVVTTDPTHWEVILQIPFIGHWYLSIATIVSNPKRQAIREDKRLLPRTATMRESAVQRKSSVMTTAASISFC